MRTRNIAKACIGLIILCGLANCASNEMVAAVDKPPVGAVTANVVVPRTGLTWTVRRKDTWEGTKDLTSRVVELNYKGTKALGESNGEQVFIFNPSSRNVIAVLRGDIEEQVYSPENPTYSWPLWVGKAWKPEFSSIDKVAGRAFTGMAPFRKVEAYEDVTVAAGTFKAFRIRISPGGNYFNKGVFWYAPELGIVVKSEFQEISARRNAIITTELLTRPN